MSNHPKHSASLKSRLKTEIRNYLVISLYLFVCFTVILLFETSLLPEKQTSLLAHGLALGKALVIGKFILIGEALDAGNRLTAPTLMHRIGYRTLAMMAVLLALKLIEEIILGWVHGNSAAGVLAELIETPWIGLVAPVLLMLLILIPLITATELNRALHGQLETLMFSRADRSAAAANSPD